MTNRYHIIGINDTVLSMEFLEFIRTIERDFVTSGGLSGKLNNRLDHS